MSAITMDTVRDLIERHSDHISGNTREFYNGAYEEIADELNSRAERTCKMQPSPFTDWAGLNMRIVAGWYCENCGECCLTETTIDDDHPTPNYCPNCGARVVE